MTSPWPTVTVADIASSERNALVGGPFGSNLVTRDYVDDGVPVIRGQNMGSRWVGGDFAYVSPSKAQSLAANLAHPDDIVFTQRGTLGQVSLVPSGLYDRFLISQSQMKLTVDRGIADPLFYYYVFSSAGQQEHIRRSAIQTGVPHTNLGILRATRVGLPPLRNQRAIAEVLGALDDRIESNRRLIALALDYVRTRLAASGPQNREPIPLGSLATFVNGGAFTKGATGTGRMVLRIAELNSGPGPSTVYNDITVGEDQLARPGDILLSWSGSIGVYRWFRPEAIINQHIFKVTRLRYPAWFVFAMLEEAVPALRSIAADKATTMGHIKRHHLDDTLVAIPEAPVVQRLDVELGPLWQRLLVAERESLTLIETRDALLPELLSGRIRIAS